MTDLPLRTDGPHSPEYTAQVSDAAAEAIRVLNYATMPGRGGLEYPADVCAVLGNLRVLADRVPQLLHQLTGFLAGQSDRVADDNGRDPVTLIAEAAFHLGQAHGSADALARSIELAHQLVSGLHVKGGGTDA